MEGGGLRAYGSGFRTLLGWDSAASRSASFMKSGPGRGGGGLGLFAGLVL